MRIDLPQTRTALFEVKPMQVPLTTDKYRLAKHAQRVADLSYGFQVQMAAFGQFSVERRSYGDVLALGIGLSWYIDLGLLPNSGAALRMAVWPGSKDGAPTREAFAADAPRFQPPRAERRCPVPGSRGGKCNERGRTGMRWVTDMATGVYEIREMCDLHRSLAVERAAGAPQPPANRGGLLLRVFADTPLDIRGAYRWAKPDWVEPGTVPSPVEDAPTERPTFTLVLGDVS